MQVKMKSYKGHIIALLLFIFVIFALFVVAMSVWLVIYPNDLKDTDKLVTYIISIILTVICLCSILLVKFCDGPNYIFEETSISIYERKKFVEKINIDNIETIYYHPFRFRYIVTIFFGELMDGGAWKLHIKLKNGTKKELSYFSLKEVKQLKEIYGDLINII